MSDPQGVQSLSEKLGATPGKLALVGVLGLVLVGSAVFNLGGGSSTSSSNKLAATPRAPRRRPAATNKNTKTKAVSFEKRPQREIEWPNLSVAEAAAFDPFAKPKFLQPPPPPPPEPDPEPEPVEELAEEELGPTPEEKKRVADTKAVEALRRTVVSLSDLGIEMIVSTPDGVMARIGGRDVKVGDVIEGLIVTRIDSEGIEVALPEDSEEEPADVE